MSTCYPLTCPVTTKLQPSAHYGVFVRQTNRPNKLLFNNSITGHAPKAATARLHLHNRGLPIGRQIAIRRSIYELKIYKRYRPRRSCSGEKNKHLIPYWYLCIIYVVQTALRRKHVGDPEVNSL